MVIFGAGTGNPYFSTDTAAVLRAAEIDADVILLAKNVDGVYTADPVKDPTAVKYDAITYDDVLAQHLMVMDSTATPCPWTTTSPVLLFALKDPGTSSGPCAARTWAPSSGIRARMRDSASPYRKL